MQLRGQAKPAAKSAPVEMTERRRCGDCTACCTSMGVAGVPRSRLDPEPTYKPPGERCAFECSRGCRIYEARPVSCHDFACVWLLGQLPKHFRPDKVGIVFTVTPDGKTLVGFWDPKRPELWRRKGVDVFLRKVGEQGAESAVGPAGGKVAFKFGLSGEVVRPDDADDFGPEVAVGYVEREGEGEGAWVVMDGSGATLAEFKSEGEAHGHAAALVGLPVLGGDPIVDEPA